MIHKGSHVNNSVFALSVNFQLVGVLCKEVPRYMKLVLGLTVEKFALSLQSLGHNQKNDGVAHKCCFVTVLWMLLFCQYNAKLNI